VSRRRLKDWLSSYLQYTENSESPQSYHRWTGLGLLSATLERRCYMQWGHSTIYPNQYIVLIGPSGRARKGEPIVIGRSFAEAVNLNLLGEDNSYESIIKIMEESLSNYFGPDKGFRLQCATACFLEELAVFTGEKNKNFLARLTNWYDGRDKWKRTTKHQGTNELIGVSFNIVASTAPDWVSMIFPHEAMGGGITSRIIFVVEEKKGQIVPNPNLRMPDQDLKKELIHDLELVKGLSGEYHFNEDALLAYERWYMKTEKKAQADKFAILDPAFAGYESRRATHVKKMSMALAAGRHDEMFITLADFEDALAMLVKVEEKMPIAFKGTGRAKYIEETEMVMGLIKSMGEVTRSEVLQRLYLNVNAYTLEQIVKTLVEMKVIQVTTDPVAKETTFLWVRKQIVDGRGEGG
jgi:hypothetical protein